MTASAASSPSSSSSGDHHSRLIPSTATSSSSLSHGSVLLSAAQADYDARDREAMNLKMEISHLRERLLMRVGGDTNAAELEAENFALKTSLMDTQESLASTQRAMATLDAKYAKALSNLVKMDHAWKSSAADLQKVRTELKTKNTAIVALHDELQQKQLAHETELAKRQTLVSYQQDKLDKYAASVRTKDAQLTQHADQQQKLTLAMKELESELASVRKRCENGESQSKQRVAKTDYEQLQTHFQQLQEQYATLRGETNALREERTSLQTQLSDTKASLTGAMAKFLQLKQENATLDVRVAAANEKSDQCERDAAFYKSEVDRLQRELTKRDEEMLQLERSTQVLELQLAQQQRKTEDAVQVRDHEAKRLELRQELSWKDREFALENQVRALTQQYEAAQADALATQQLHEELLVMLGESGSGGHDLKTRVAQTLARNSETMVHAQQQQRQVARLEKELAKMKALAEENQSLKAEYEKTRRAMERIVGRKTKSTAATTTTATSAATSTAGSAATSVFAVQRRPNSEKLQSTTTSDTSLVGTKRKLVLPSRTMGTSSSTTPSSNLSASGSSGGNTPSSDGPFSPRSKRVVHVASRYMQATKSTKR